MELAKDTPTSENEITAGQDGMKVGSGKSDSPGGQSAPSQSIGDMTHGGESYPGPRAGGESDKTGDAADAST